MNSRKSQLVMLAIALSGAAGMASAQQAGTALGPTPAAVKAAVDVQGNAALTNEIALSGTPRQGSPGTQSGVAVTHTSVMGAPAAWVATTSRPSFAALSDAQLRALERYNALR